jgi:methylmalonyl-CoA mutase cobalamin-binding domain/chain
MMVIESVENGTSIDDIYTKVFEPALREVGRLWHNGQISVAIEHYTTTATRDTMHAVALSQRNLASAGGHRAVVTCAGGELHDLGAYMVSERLQAGGWESYYLGANTPADATISAVEHFDAQVLGISSTLSIHLGHVRELIDSLKTGSASDAKVVVGGYPFNLSASLCDKVGADAYAPDAVSAVRVFEDLVTG